MDGTLDDAVPIGDSSGSAGPAMLVLGLDRRRAGALLLLVATALGLLGFAYRSLDDLARAGGTPLLEPLVQELTGAYGGVLLLTPILLLAHRLRLDRRHRLAWLAFHGLAVLAFSGLHTAWNWLSRSALYPILGLGSYDYGRLPVRFAMELPKDVTVYVLVLAFATLLERYRASRERELRAARLETRLAQAQLQNLQAQLEPHFLFNTLNAISSVMYDDVRAADRMLTRLSDLLRQALHASRTQEVTLAEELELTTAYLDLMRTRFGDRLRTTFDMDPSTRGARVPALLLQPLVENAIRHGAPPTPRPAHLTIRGRREGGTLVLEVEDDGPGLERPEEPLLGRGLGLTNTHERLRGLHGPQAGLDWREAAAGGLIVRARLPFILAETPREEAWTVSAS